MLRARVRLFAGCGVRHVSIEGDRTFQGDPRPLAPPFSSVEQYVVHLPEGKDSGYFDIGHGPNWNRERLQRNAVLDVIKDEPDDTVVLICDADELIDPTRLDDIVRRARRGPTHLILQNFYYGPQWQGPDFWFPVAVTAGWLRSSRQTPFDLRTAGLARVRNAGWHCSYWGGQAKIEEKLAAFSHTEVSEPERKRRILDGSRTGTGPNGEPLVLSSGPPKYVLHAIR